MSVLTTILGSDEQSASRTIINNNFTALNTDKADKSNNLSQFASTTSAELAGNLSDNIGTWPLVFWNANWWTSADETWTYASATTFTVSGDRTTKYQRGDRIMLTQTTVKYFVVTNVAYWAPNTTVTITGGTDYTLANAVISSNYYSKQLSPQGYPDWFNFTPSSYTGFSSNPTLSFANFRILGSTYYCNISFSGNGTSNATGFTIVLPDGIKCVGQAWGDWGYPVDNWASISAVYCYILNNTSSLVMAKRMDDPNTWTAANWKRAEASIQFQFTI